MYGLDSNMRKVYLGTYDLYAAEASYTSSKCGGKYSAKIYVRLPEYTEPLRSPFTMLYMSGVPGACIIVVGTPRGRASLYNPLMLGGQAGYMPFKEEGFSYDSVQQCSPTARLKEGIGLLMPESLDLWDAMPSLLLEGSVRDKVVREDGYYVFTVTVMPAGTHNISEFDVPVYNVSFTGFDKRAGRFVVEGYALVSPNSLVPVEMREVVHADEALGIRGDGGIMIRLTGASLSPYNHT